jgi:dipeptidyl aminopeptidase/acylaminoacyl peptidase
LSYPYLKAGDPIPLGRPRLFRVADRLEVSLDDALFCEPWEIEFLRWSDDGEKFYLLYNQRGHQCLRLLEVAAATGAVRAIVDEVSPTFIHYSSEGKFELRWLANRELLWASERSGWNHLYRYDLASGAVLNAVTSGEWNVRRIESIDEDSGVVFFYAVGVRGDQDPYHEHFCRVNRDGSEFRILTQGDGTHQIEWSPDRAAFVDRYSRVDLPPVLELRDASTGRLICSLEQADASEVVAARGSFPERFVAKGRDGVTDIWGILHRPRDFDPQRRYPVIENIYAGPHDHHVPKDFRASYRHQQQIADAGFVVVQIDGMGTAWRSKAFHDVCYRNLRDAGFPDRIAWIKAAAERYPFLDLARVGIYGGSAGGQNAMAALLWHGDFYRAAVADCGCHDNRMDKIWWNEQWLGLPDGDHYAANSNTEHADQMQGHLMLVVGELDRNVDPSSTTQVVGRLIKADKDFEFLLVVGSGHGACETPWAARRRIQFFQSHLPADATRE